jgi:phospholipid transport system substrate-binding protein
MKSKSLLLLALCALPLVAQAATTKPVATKAADPVAEIRKNDQQLQTTLRSNKTYTAAQQDSLKKLINGMFSFSELGKRALGKHWTTLKKPQQDSFVAVFRRLVENTSVKRLENYKADSTVYSAATGTGDKTQVVATVYNRGKGSKVIYKLFPVDGTWRAWDLVLDGSSTLQSYRTQFNSLIAKEGFDGLMARLRKSAGK